MTLREFLGILRRRWRLIALCTLLTCAAALGASLLQPKVYTSTTTIYLSTESKTPEGGKALGAVPRQDLATYVKVLSSPKVTERIRQRAGLPAGTPFGVTAFVDGETSLLNVIATSDSGENARRVAAAAGPGLAEVAPEFSTLLPGSGSKVISAVVTPAMAPLAPSSPRLVRNALLGLMVGLFLGIAIALVRHTLDSKVRGDQDIERVSDRPLLAHVPRRTGKALATPLQHADPTGPQAEAIRRLRTNIRFVDAATGGHAYVISSAMPGDGKTTTVVNLALAMAQDGARVLLVDCDLRKPRVARSLGLEGAVGLTTLLLRDAEPEDVIQEWGDSGLHVLAAGEIPPNPSELLGSTPMRQLFEGFKQSYDLVLVDSPPVVPVSDALLLERVVGPLILLVGMNRTPKRALQSAIRQITTVGGTVAGFVMNYAEARGGSYGYAYGYAYAYGYGDGSSRKRRRRRRRGVSSSGLVSARYPHEDDENEHHGPDVPPQHEYDERARAPRRLSRR